MTKNIQGTKLFAFCILPDHMHLVVHPGEKGLSTFMQSLKMNSSRDARRWLAVHPSPRSSDSGIAATGFNHLGWQKGYHDEHIRDAAQRTKALRYVQNNAYLHHLVAEPTHWPWTSLNFPDLLDEMEIWF